MGKSILHTFAPRRMATPVVGIIVTIVLIWGSTASAQTGQRGQERAPKRSGQRDLDSLFADLSPVNSGPGIIIFEPRVSGPSEGIADFAAGCSRWLQFTVGGMGSLGRTPTWSSIDEVRKERGLPGLRLKPEDASPIAAALGTTHFVVGEAKGAAENITIEYRIYARGGQRTIGAPISLAGTPAAIVQSLPDAAMRIAKALGVADGRAPQKCSAGPSGLRLMGRVPWIVRDDTPGKEIKELGALCESDAAATPLILLSDAVPDPGVWAAAKRAAAKAALGNAIACHTLIAGAQRRAPDHADVVNQAAERYPNNYLINASLLRIAEFRGDARDALKLARVCAQCASFNARAWYRLGSAYGLLAQQTRQGRVIGRMSQEELNSIFRLYPYWAAAAKRATELDPKFSQGWLDYSTACCFDGEEETADSAFWRAASLDPNGQKVIWWGLEMYQPKWMDDPAKLIRVAEKAVNAPWPNPMQGLDAASHLRQASPALGQAAQSLTDRMERIAREAVAKDSLDVWGNMALARLAQDRGDFVEAANRYIDVCKRWAPDSSIMLEMAKSAIKHARAGEILWLLQDGMDHGRGSAEVQAALNDVRAMNPGIAPVKVTRVSTAGSGAADDAPRQAVAASTEPETGPVAEHLKLAKKYIESGNVRQTEEETREALRIDPKSPRAHCFLGYVLLVKLQYKEAEEELNLALKSLPDDSETIGRLGDIRSYQGKYAESIPFYKKSIRLNPKDIRVQTAYLIACVKLNDLEMALSASKTALTETDGNPSVRFFIAYIHKLRNEYDLAIPEYRQCIKDQTLPLFRSMYHYQLGEILWLTGQKDEARAEMERCIADGPSGEAKEAKKKLNEWK